jgi:ubiquinone/menaquinone biosynthesis C-methylase UbiE
MFGRKRGPRAAGPVAPAQDWRSFDAVAAEYERVRAPVHQPAAVDLVEALGPPAPGGLLDVGSGTGVLAAAAQAAGWTPVAGVDRSVPMLRLGRPRGLDRVAAADAVDLPFRDATFAAVTAAFVLHLVTRYDTVLHDMLRVLRPGGRLGAATWVGAIDEFTGTWRSVAERHATKELLDDALRKAAPWQERFADPGRLEETLRDAGLRNVDVDRRSYRSSTTVADYLAGRETSAAGRFLRQILGEDLWERFRDAVGQAFRERFPDPIGDTNEVLLAVGTKP